MLLSKPIDLVKNDELDIVVTLLDSGTDQLSTAVRQVSGSFERATSVVAAS
jgi:hypothetical protein